MRRRTRRFLTIGALLASGAAAVPLAASALPRGVILLHGTNSQELTADFSYGAKGRTINGFRMYFTCRGKRPELGSDLYTISDGGNDAKPLARAKSDGSVSFDLKGRISRRLDEGLVPQGSGRLVVRATVMATGSQRILKGTTRVRSARCPSAELTFRAVGRVKS
jgi:hypothetical protein